MVSLYNRHTNVYFPIFIFQLLFPRIPIPWRWVYSNITHNSPVDFIKNIFFPLSTSVIILYVRIIYLVIYNTCVSLLLNHTIVRSHADLSICIPTYIYTYRRTMISLHCFLRFFFPRIHFSVVVATNMSQNNPV